MRTPTEIQQDLDQTADELRRQGLRNMGGVATELFYKTADVAIQEDKNAPNFNIK